MARKAKLSGSLLLVVSFAGRLVDIARVSVGAATYRGA